LPIPTVTPAIIPDFLFTSLGELPELDLPPTSVPCGTAGYVFRGQFPSQIAGPTRTYSAYLPPCYGENGRSYPTLYLFHGSIQTDSHWLDLGLAHHLDQAIADGRYPPLIVIMPFNDTLGNITSGGGKSIEAITVEELLPFVDSHFCTWHDRAGRSLGGISRGGYWALMIAFRHTDLFAAVAGHSSHLRYETDSATYNPLSTYATADLSQMRIWLDWGETDFLRTGQQQLDAALTAAGIEHQTTVNGGGHNDGYWTVHLREYLDWQTAVWPHDPAFYPPCA
jgi:enterochelin esterase-like enzyme